MFSLFVSNAMINAAKYVEYCERDGITKIDLEYGMKYEISEFAKRENILADIEEMRKEYYEELEAAEASDSETGSEDELEEEEDELKSMIVNDEEIEAFCRISSEKINNVNREFITKMHKYYNDWNSWEPYTPFERILKNAINII